MQTTEEVQVTFLILILLMEVQATKIVPNSKKKFTLKTPFVDEGHQTYPELFSQIHQLVFVLEQELISDAEFVATYILIFIQHQSLLKKAKDLKISKLSYP